MTDGIGEQNARYLSLCEEGRFLDALNLVQGRTIDDALNWFAEAGVRFWRPPDQPDAQLSHLAHAASEAIDGLGDKAGPKQQVAYLALMALANLREVITRPSTKSIDAVNRIAEIVIAGATVGSAEGMMTAARLNIFEKLAEHEFDRMRRRAGAEATHAKKRSIQEQACDVALAITATNPTLSNEELANKVKTRLNLTTTTRTVTGWMRDARRNGRLPPLAPIT